MLRKTFGLMKDEVQEKVTIACTTGSFFIALLTNCSSDQIKKDKAVREREREVRSTSLTECNSGTTQKLPIRI